MFAEEWVHAPADVWMLIERFFRARAEFQAIYDGYESRVLKYAQDRAVDRRYLRLNAEEVAGLLDFRALEALRDGAVAPLKEVSHHLFRQIDATDSFDRYVSQIYHELSILKEEQYKVATYAVEYARLNEKDEYDNILDEVHEAFPQKVHGIFNLFAKAQVRLEQIISDFADDRVLVRSVYLFGDELLRPFYPNGIEDFYQVLYGEGGTPRGFLVAGKSFHEAAFHEHARECLQRALDAAAQMEAPPETVRAAAREAEALLDRLRPGPKKKVGAA